MRTVQEFAETSIGAVAWRHRSPLVLAVIVGIVTLLIANDPVRLDTSIIIAIYSLMALSVGMTWGQGGILSVAQAAFAAIGAYSAAIVTVTWGGPIWLGLLGALAIPALIAYPMARLTIRLTPLALAIATLAFGEVLYMLLREGGSLTGGFIGLAGVPLLPFAEGQLSFHFLVWGLVILVVILYGNLVRSSWGTALRTIRNDHMRAKADGINVPHASGLLFAVASSIAGLAGWLYAHYISYVAPESLSTNLSITVILMAVVGGAAYVLGPVLGAFLLTIGSDYIPAAEIHGLIYGALVIAIIVAAPAGILGSRIPWLSRKARRSAAETSASRTDESVGN